MEKDSVNSQPASKPIPGYVLFLIGCVTNEHIGNPAVILMLN